MDIKRYLPSGITVTEESSNSGPSVGVKSPLVLRVGVVALFGGTFVPVISSYPREYPARLTPIIQALITI